MERSNPPFSVTMFNHPPPASRSSSYYGGPSRSSTPTLGVQEKNESLSHRLKHMFDSSKGANFAAHVTIHELGNVPQLGGEFAVEWKFRGKRPKTKDLEQIPKVKPSLPNLKLAQTPLTAIHPSPSTTSLSTKTSSTASSPNVPVHPPVLRKQSSVSSIPSRCSTLPVGARTPSGPSRQSSMENMRGQGKKKTTDPTPLRQSMGPPPPPVKVAVASPELMAKDFQAEPSTDMLHPDSAKNIESSSEAGASIDSRKSGSGSSNGSLLPAPMMSYTTSSAASSSSHLSSLGPRPPARSGTNPSPATLLDAIPGRSEVSLPGPKAMSRTPSYATGSTSSANSAMSTPHPLPRGRTSPSNRKGTTASSSLQQHTCTWNSELDYTMRVNLGKAVSFPPAAGSRTPPRRPAPLLGAGPLSDSGLHLEVWQLPTPSATSTSSATGADGTLPSMLAAVHRTHHPEGKPNPSERGSAVPELQKMKFGTIDVDLAAFAGKGKVTRRFLLKGSRTNATIKLTVEMKWVGGEEVWVAPPMQEGHHVTGMHDLIGPDAEERMRGDLSLAKTPSNSSSASSLSGHTRSNPSMASSLNLSRNPSNVSAVAPPRQVDYKTYEHHLRPVTPAETSSSGNSPSILRKHSHRRHHHHSRHLRDMPPIQRFSTHDLPPEVIIEAIFNPHASTEETPFTFIPVEKQDNMLGPDHVLQNFIMSTGLDEEKEDETAGMDNGLGNGGKKEKSHWRWRKEKREKEKKG